MTEDTKCAQTREYFGDKAVTSQRYLGYNIKVLLCISGAKKMQSAQKERSHDCRFPHTLDHQRGQMFIERNQNRLGITKGTSAEALRA